MSEPINILNILEKECETARAISQIFFILCFAAEGNSDTTLPEINDILWIIGKAAEEHAQNLKSLTDDFSKTYM